MSAITERRSIRKYKDTPVAKDRILTLLEAARLAPSGNNTQPWRFLVVTDEEKKKAIVHAEHDQQWMLTAPVFIAVLADLGARTAEPLGEPLNEQASSNAVKLILRDAAIAVTHILLAAEKEGLGTCWTGFYKQEEMRAVLGVPETFWVSGIVTVGVADETPAMRPRKPLEELVCFETWDK
ncbi:MAG: nitroreductase family protein [Clostridia bacterium]|nr:nitroreductase family protein [Clostridia bacterium]